LKEGRKKMEEIGKITTPRNLKKLETDLKIFCSFFPASSPTPVGGVADDGYSNRGEVES
jgi:hypothetical protein